MNKKVKKPATTPPVVNRRARFDYELGDELIVGMSLTGPQVRAVRDHRVQIQGSFVKASHSGELFLTGATFSIRGNGKEIVSDTSDIKLLATRKQIDQFLNAKVSGQSIVPTKILSDRKYIKLVIALGKGKKKYDKRETIKRREQDRESRKITA